MTTPTYRIAKLGYSAKPWRIVAPHGDELHLPIPGATSFTAPVCFDTKADAIAWLGQELWDVVQRHQRLVEAHNETKAALTALIDATEPILATQSATNELAMALLEAKVAR